MMEFVNIWTKESDSLNAEEQQMFLKILAPFAPHMTEELWQQSQNCDGSTVKDSKGFNSIHHQSWPEYASELLVRERVEIPVQFNGKRRFSLQVESQKAEDKSHVESLTMRHEKAKRWLEGKEVKRVVFVPGRLVNVVVT
jgi:leucyl-tRNA synthetase